MAESSEERLDCGCIVQEKLSLEVESINLDCNKVWELLKTGKNKGIFQLDSGLGRKFCKLLEPKSIKDISALISIVRPGCLEAEDENGKSMAVKYCDRQNCREEAVPIHPCLTDILKDTNQILIYQESILRIAAEIAGLSLEAADSLRKALSKKLPEEMVKCKTEFLDGCKNIGIVDEVGAILIFNNIEKSQRYLFNASHSYSYSIDAYITALLKVHYPLQFYTAKLRLSNYKIEPRLEVKELIQDARSFDIKVLPPDLRAKNKEFIIRGDGILFGLGHIKGLGESVLKATLGKIQEAETKTNTSIENFSWNHLLLEVLWPINSIASKALISCGALDYLKIPRTEMLFHLQILEQLSPKEIEWLTIYGGNSLIDALKIGAKAKKDGGAAHNKNRLTKILDLIKLLESPPRSMIDSIDWCAFSEESLLGIALSVAKVDGCAGAVKATSTCDEFARKCNPAYTVLGVSINKVREHKIKQGNSKGEVMSFLTVEDGSAELDSVIAFPDTVKEFGHLLTAGNTVLLRGERSAKKDSFIVNSVYQI